MKSILAFLNQIKENNSKEWLDAHREEYQVATQSFNLLVEQLIAGISEFDSSIKGITVKDCTYRFNRDIRFSANKMPYKTHFGAFICPKGKNSGFSGYYFHIEPGKSIMAGGAYTPPAPWLSSIREKISDSPDEFIKITKAKDFIKYFGSVDGEKLKTAPKGYPKDHPHIELLKLKSYLVVNEATDKLVLSSDFQNHVINVFKTMKPLNDYLNI